jgi:outer membrane lipoprotein-sorting protein
MTFTRRLLLAGLMLAPAGRALAQQRGGLSADDKALVDRAVAYLQGLTRAKGRFTQTDPRGHTSAGEIYLQRPGKARMVYDKPNELLVVSDGNQVAVQDKRLRTYELYALNVTPLSLFLAREIRLDRNVQVTRVRRLPGGFSITARDRGKDTPGQITLVFSDKPMALKEWTIIDAQGGATRVVLNSLTPVSSLDRSLFVLPRDPRPRGGQRP